MFQFGIALGARDLCVHSGRLNGLFLFLFLDLISGVGHCLGSVTLLFELGLLDGKYVVLLRDLGLCRDARVVGGLVGFCLRDPGLSDLAHCVTDDQF